MLDNNTQRTYKFDYGNVFKKILCYLIQFIANSGVILFGFVFCFILVQFVSNNLGNTVGTYILNVLLVIIQAAISLFFGIYTFLPRKVVLHDNYIKIQKNAMNFFVGKSWFSEVVPYTSIVSCELYDNTITCRNSQFLRQQAYPCTFFNWDSLVKITDKYNNSFYIPVKNAENFIEEVNMIIELKTQ